MLDQLNNQEDKYFKYKPLEIPELHLCSANWNEVYLDYQRYYKLVHMQQNKFVVVYCMRGNLAGTKYGHLYCRFAHPKDLCGRFFCLMILMGDLSGCISSEK